jgi:hypothetical protein
MQRDAIHLLINSIGCACNLPWDASTVPLNFVNPMANKASDFSRSKFCSTVSRRKESIHSAAVLFACKNVQQNPLSNARSTTAEILLEKKSLQR